MKRVIADIYPLSPMQEGMLYHYLANPNSELYFEQTCVELQGELDFSRFQAAWDRLVKQNEALRTIFRWEGLEHPLQIVLAPAARPHKIHPIDLREIDPAERSERLEAVKGADRRRGFALDRGPLARFTVCLFPEEICAVIFSFHHIILDGWSTGILWKELFETYQALQTGHALSGERKLKYRDYIRFLEERNAGESSRFWRTYLQDYTVPAQIPHDFSATAGMERVSEEVFTLADEKGLRLNEAVKQYKVTPNVILLAAWGHLLQRYSSLDDVVFGATTSGRPANLPGIQNSVGLFINTVPVRVRSGGNLRVKAVWSQLMEETLARTPHEYLSLVEIRAQSDLPFHTALFESILVFENYPIDETLHSMDLGVRFLSMTGHEMTNFPLTLTAVHGTTMTVKMSYNSALYRPTAMRRLMQNLHHLLVEMIGNPEGRMCDLELLSVTEREQLRQWEGGPELPIPEGKCIHQLFLEQARLIPGETAVRCGGGSLTYGELDGLSDRFALVLRQHGIGAESLVGIMVERSLEMVIALLGILKAGAAYLPIDPQFPQERTRYMLEDSRVGMVLTQDTLAAEVRKVFTRQILTIEEALKPKEDSHTRAGEALPARERESGDPVTPRSPAYVIYTSGSTGRPKGIQIQHRPVVNCLQAFREILTPRHRKRFLALTTICFDISVLELFLPLTAGLELVIAGSDLQRDPVQLNRLLTDQAIEIVQMTPSSMQMLIHAGLSAPQLTEILLGGEALPPKVLRWLQENTQARVLNVYGPTETTIWSMVQDVTGSAEITLGRPIANTQVYLLDGGLRRVPTGVVGEIFIGGEGLASGYPGRPELTAERFLFDPYRPGHRMYRTGDLGRRLEDGTIEYHGRTDNQVKIRGHRIEIGEIESVLSAAPEVRECAVTVRTDQTGDPYLAAYVVLNGIPAESAGPVPGLREYLRKVLPDYMVPAAFVILQQLPLTPNGKVDRKALPAPEGGVPASAAYASPRNGTEAAIARIWAEVLGHERIGIHDNFFERGGHSLKVTRILSRMQKAFGVQVTLERFFQDPTVAGLAGALQMTEQRHFPPIPACSRQPHYPASHSQKRLWVLDKLERGLTAYNMPSAYILWGDLQVEVLRRALTGVVERHEILRTGFKLIDTELVQFVADAFQPDVPYQDLRAQFQTEGSLSSPALFELVDREAARPFDLEQPGLVRFSICRLRDEAHLVLVTMHHIISDEWSSNILISEVVRLYEAECRGQKNPLAPLRIQYRDFTIWQNRFLGSEEMAREERFWLEHLRGQLPLLNLPTDYPRPAVKSFAGDAVTFRIAEDLMQNLEELAQRQEVTLYMLFLTAYYILLYCYTGQEDLIVGTPVAGRRDEELEQLIGFFVNSLPLRMRCRRDESFMDLLRRVRAMALQAFDAQDYPFDHLVVKLGSRRDPGRSAIFDTLFNLLNFRGQGGGAQVMRAGGLRFEHVNRAVNTSKLDIALSVMAAEGAVTGVFEYCTALFKRVTVQEISDNFQRILAQISADPGTGIMELRRSLSGSKLRLPLETNPKGQEADDDFNF